MSYFALLGRIAGFALYHCETIPANWTTAFIKAAFGYTLVAADIASVDPELHEKRIAYLLDSTYASRDGMALADLGLTFEDEHQFEEYSANRAKIVDLKPGGSEIEVTEEAR